MSFTQLITFTVTAEGLIERSTGQVPSVLRTPALSVTIAPTATAQATARLLRRLADELEAGW
jgi:hypothetical protein